MLSTVVIMFWLTQSVPYCRAIGLKAAETLQARPAKFPPGLRTIASSLQVGEINLIKVIHQLHGRIVMIIKIKTIIYIL